MPTPAVLAEVLYKLGICGERLDGPFEHRYLIGERFLQHLSFMGCAPALEFEPQQAGQPDWASFTFVLLTPLFEEARFLVDQQMARPRCPHCRKRTSLTSEQAKSCQQTLECEHCGKAASVAQWDWREYGACSRLFFSIVNVYPKESIPTDSFMQQLASATHCSWHYFYIHDVLPDVTN